MNMWKHMMLYNRPGPKHVFHWIIWWNIGFILKYILLTWKSLWKSSNVSFLEAQLLYNYINVRDSPTHTALSSIFPLFVDWFWRSLRFYHLEFVKKKPFLKVLRLKMPGIGGRIQFLSDFIELNLIRPCGHCLAWGQSLVKPVQ